MLNDRLLQFVNIDLQEVKVLENYLIIFLENNFLLPYLIIEL
jgi:hypothetical protein